MKKLCDVAFITRLGGLASQAADPAAVKAAAAKKEVRTFDIKFPPPTLSILLLNPPAPLSPQNIR